MQKKDYEPLAKKYGLPEFKEIDKVFEISDVEIHNGSALRHIRKKIVERLDVFASFIGEVVFPEPSSLTSMHECKFFTEKDKEEAFKIYSRLLFLMRSASEQEVIPDEKKDAAYIKSVFSEWSGIQQQVLPYVHRMKEAWKTKLDEVERVNYMG